MIINSLLDTDLYKLTMMQVVLHHFPGNRVEYQFVCRTKGIDLSPYADEITQEINHLCTLRFEEDELDYLSSLRFIKRDFVDFLRIFKLNTDCIEIKTEPEFAITIRGPWLHTILFEVPVLAIISEVYSRNTHANLDLNVGRKLLKDKIEIVKQSPLAADFKFSDFGTRRRFSRDWHREVVETIAARLPEQFTGTSNVKFAMELDLKPHGTMAHEYIQACQASGPRLIDSQKFAFEKWAQEYRGDLGIALTDTYSLNAFLNDFDLYFCKLFDGVRQDSGDPYEWGDRIIAHYKEMAVDPKTKTIVFSDNLTIPKALALLEHFKDQTNPVFGIGTHLTNDMGFEAMQIVIKMSECNGQAVAKISSSPEKIICKDPSYLKYLKNVFKIDE